MVYFLISRIMLRKYNFYKCKHVLIHCDPHVRLFPVKNDEDVINQKEYASMIGSLRYATDCTRLDIAYAVGKLSRFTSKPGSAHWLAIERILKYLSGTIKYGLFYNKYQYLKVTVMPIGIPCQVIHYQPLVTYLHWELVL